MADFLDDLLEEPVVLWLLGASVTVWFVIHPDPVLRWGHRHLQPGLHGVPTRVPGLPSPTDLHPTTIGIALGGAGLAATLLGLVVVAVLRRRLRDQFPLG